MYFGHKDINKNCKHKDKTQKGYYIVANIVIIFVSCVKKGILLLLL